MADLNTTSPPPTRNTWTEYVSRVMRGDTQGTAARKTGIDQTTISRWLSGNTQGRLTPKTVRAFAYGYNRPVLEAFVQAGLLSSSEVGYDFSTHLDLTGVTDKELIQEMARRLEEPR